MRTVSHITALVVLIGMASTLDASARDWPHTTEFRERLAWIHPLVNYAINPQWQRDWERHLLQGGGLQTTVGSVATEDFSTSLTVNLNQPLSGRFRFLYRGRWLEGLHLDADVNVHWLGFEMALAGPVGIHLQVHPTADKEEMDLSTGLTLVDASRERYLRLSVRLDDFIYGKKNDLGGVSDNEAVGLEWEGRYAAGRWEFFTAGRQGSPAERSYPDAGESSELAAWARDTDLVRGTIRYLTGDGDFLAMGADHYDYAAAETWRDGDGGYDYDNEVLHLRTHYLWRTAHKVGFRPELHWLRQWSAAEGYWSFDHRREDFFPALFMELRTPGRSTWELGYMATHHRWDWTEQSETDHYDGYTDKVKLGWTFAFTPVALLQLSLSHEVDLERFGGGNVQFQVLF